jgi:pimeloyl-ACP methyl ester carboxylesterase
MEFRGSLHEIRPGRTLFVQKAVLGRGPTTPQEASTSLVNLVCVHGTCASHEQFHKLHEALQSHLVHPTSNKISSPEESQHHHNDVVINCYSYDAVGCGQSPVIQDWDAYRTSEAVLDLQALLQKIQQETERHNVPTILMGHSYGPNVILKLLLQLQEKSQDDVNDPKPNVKGLILMSTGCKGGPFPLHDGGHAIMKLPLIVLQCLQPTLTKEFIKLAYHPETPSHVVEASRRHSNGNSMWVAKAYHQHHEWITSHQAKQAVYYDNIDDDGTTSTRQPLPCLVLHGTTDGILPLEAGRFVADQLQADFISIEPASHQVMEEQPDQVAQATLLFLQQFFH